MSFSQKQTNSVNARDVVEICLVAVLVFAVPIVVILGAIWLGAALFVAIFYGGIAAMAVGGVIVLALPKNRQCPKCQAADDD